MNRIATTIARSIFISICMMSANAIAESTDFTNLEEQERAQIISELTFHLETKQVCTQTLVWDDSGSGADLDGYFFTPTLGKNEYMIGGHASQKRNSKYHCVTTVSVPASKPKGAPALLVSPADWKQVWKDSGSGATRDGSFWQAISPDNNYKCIGSVSQIGHNNKPNLPNYRCVHTNLTDKITASSIIWSDKGTGADKQVTILALPATGAFIAVGSSSSKVETYDLKKNAASVPDAKMVEELLAKRLGPIKADIEEKTAAIREKKALAKKEEAKKVEQEKLTAVAAKEKQAEVADKKAIEAQAMKEKNKEEKSSEEAKTLAVKAEEEAQNLKEQQQMRIAKAAAEKEQQKMAVQEQEAEPEPISEPVKEEAQPEQAIEEPAEESVSASEPKKESKGLDDIMMFFVKVFAMMVGGVIIFLVAFKVLFGKKKTT
jgi:VPS62-like protein